MKTVKKLAALLLAAVFALALLTGCNDDSADSEVDTRKFAAEVSAAITLPDGMDSTARFAQKYVDGGMVVVYNGISQRDTEYFMVPGGQLTFTMQASGESPTIKNVKAAVWTKLDGGTQYVEGTTVYFPVGEKATQYVIDGLDPALEYRLTISYDSGSYYASGKLQVDGAVDPTVVAAAASSAASQG